MDFYADDCNDGQGRKAAAAILLSPKSLHPAFPKITASCFPQNHCILCKSNANKAANARPDILSEPTRQMWYDMVCKCGIM